MIEIESQPPMIIIKKMRITRKTSTRMEWLRGIEKEKGK